MHAALASAEKVQRRYIRRTFPLTYVRIYVTHYFRRAQHSRCSNADFHCSIMRTSIAVADFHCMQLRTSIMLLPLHAVADFHYATSIACSCGLPLCYFHCMQLRTSIMLLPLHAVADFHYATSIV